MASLSKTIQVFSDGSLKVSAPPAMRFWRVRHDVELRAGVWYRTQLAGIWRASLPEVFWLNEAITDFGEAWQKLSYELNPGMDRKKWRVVHDYKRAFHNWTGFDEPGDPRADYVNRLDMKNLLPKWDKTRVCGGATITGRVEGNYLIVEILDGNGPAPTIEELRARPWLWFHAVNSTEKGITNFPQNGGKPVLVPLVGSGVARAPLAALEEVPGIADPYFIGYRPKEG